MATDTVTTNKAQLMAALGACTYDQVTVIEHRRETGTTRFTIGKQHTTETEQRFQRRLRSMVRNVERTPAHVWQ